MGKQSIVLKKGVSNRCNMAGFLSLEFTSEPKAVPERPDREARDGEAEVGNGVQGLPGVRRRLHEHAGTCPLLQRSAITL